MDVRIVGVNLPGRSWCDRDNIHVGIQRKAEVVEMVAGDAAEAVWDFTLNVDGADFRGPYVQGRKGERFVYLSWGMVDEGGGFEMFRRAKLILGAIDRDVVEAADRPGRRLVGTLGLTGGDGGPRCAAVRPPMIDWAAAPA
jgi:hypothetical protein